MKPTNKLMKRLSLYLFLIFFTFQTTSWADDIRDFQIEGMSIGDSLLDFMDKSEMDFLFLYRDKSFKTTYFDKPKIYDDIQITVKSDDNNYIIHNISGKIYYRKNYEECLKDKIEITKEFQFLISSKVKTQSEDNIKRLSDPTGNSTWSYYAFYLTDGDVAQVFCTDWSEELLKSKNYVDELKTGLYSVEFRNFLANE
jgi:hypothetical protein